MSFICFECGGRINGMTESFVSQEVYPPEQGATHKMIIRAHIKCAKDSLNKWPAAQS